MTLLNTAESWRNNILWVNERINKQNTRNTTVPIENSKSGATMERFYKRYIHSLLALSFTDEYQYIVDEHNISNLLISSISPEFLESYPGFINSNLDLLEVLGDISTLKKNYPTDNIYSVIFSDDIFILKSKALEFVVYFMTSFYNLNDLVYDYQRIFTNRKKQEYEVWEKTAYFNQTIAEIYREDFLFTMLLEVLNLSINSNGHFTVEEIKNIYNGYLKNEPISEEDFSYKYLYDLQSNRVIRNELAPGDELHKWFGDRTWRKSMEGILTLTSSKSTSKSVANFLIPKEITTLDSDEVGSALHLILELFVINTNYDAVIKDLSDLKETDPDAYQSFYNYEWARNTLNSQKLLSKDIALQQLKSMDFLRTENDFHHSQYRLTLTQALPLNEDKDKTKDENSDEVSKKKNNEDDKKEDTNEATNIENKQYHYILNPQILELIRSILNEIDREELQIDFIQILI